MLPVPYLYSTFLLRNDGFPAGLLRSTMGWVICSCTNVRAILGRKTCCPLRATGQYIRESFGPPAVVSPHASQARSLLRDGQQGRCLYTPFPGRGREYCL